MGDFRRGQPAHARSVRAIADDSVSAGWQHMKSRTSVSSSSGSIPIPVAGESAQPRSPAAAATLRCAGSPSCAARLPGSATRADFPNPVGRPLQRPPPAALPAPHLPRRRNCRSGGSPRRAPAAPVPAAGARMKRPASQQIVRRPAHHLPHLDGHVHRRAVLPRRRRRPRRDRVRLPGILHVDNPVARQEFL